MADYRIEREARDLEEHIEELLRFWSEAQNMQRQLDDFNENNQAPEPPAKFDSVVALLEYDDRKRLYEKDLEGYELRAAGHQQTFEQKSAQLMDFFPDGVALVYRYQSYGAGPVGKTFEIQKVVADQRSSIKIRELDS